MKKILLMSLLFILFSCWNEIENNKNIETEKIDLENKKLSDDYHKKIRIKQNNYPKVEINKLSSEFYLKYKNKEEVDRNFYLEHIIYWEWIIVDTWSTSLSILFNLDKKWSLDEDFDNNPYIVKIRWDKSFWLKVWDNVKFSWPIWSLWWNHNSPWWNFRWKIYLYDYQNKEYSYVTKIY